MENAKNTILHISTTGANPDWMKPSYLKHSAHAHIDSENATFGFEHQFSIQSSFAVQLMDQINDEIVKQVIDAAKEAGINDVYLLNKEFILKAIRDALDKENLDFQVINGLCKNASLELENQNLRRRVGFLFDENDKLRMQKIALLKENADLRSRISALSKSDIESRVIDDEVVEANRGLMIVIRDLETERNKARAGCQRLREENEKLIIENGELKKGNVPELELLRKRIQKLNEENVELKTNFDDMVKAYKAVDHQYDSAKIIIKKLIKEENE